MPERVNIYIPASNGIENIASVTANSSRDAMQKAVAFFLLDWWKGPKPKVGMILRIVDIYNDFEYRMRVTDEMMRAPLER